MAELAGKVSSLLVEIEKLRAEIEVESRQVMALVAKETSLKKSLEQRFQSPVPMIDGSNALAMNAAIDDTDVAFQQERLETVTANLKARRMSVQRTQDLIATRITTVQRMLELFTRIEDGVSARPRVRRRIRRVRRRK